MKLLTVPTNCGNHHKSKRLSCFIVTVCSVNTSMVDATHTIVSSHPRPFVIVVTLHVKILLTARAVANVFYEL